MAPLNAGKLKLAIVDDDPSVVRIATAMLATGLKNRAEIFAFTDPQGALPWIEANRLDLLLTDLDMPGIDGLEMLRVAKQQNPRTQVIVMTPRSSGARVSDAMEAGASNYLLKPLLREEILSVVEQEYARCARWQNVVNGSLDRQVGQLA